MPFNFGKQTFYLILICVAFGPGAAWPVDETVEVNTGGLGVPGEQQSPETPDDGPVDPLKVVRPPSEFVEIPLTPALPQAEIVVPEDAEEVEAHAASCLEILKYLGDTSAVEGPILTLEDAIQLALANNPQLVTLALEVDARLAQVLQARLKPSPELDISLSEFLGMNERRHFRRSVSEVTYSKTVERLEKRLARMRVARLGGDVARWDYEAAIRDIQQAVARAYVDVLVAQENVRVQRQLFNLAEGLRGAVALRFEAGTVSELELSRLEIEVTNARISVEQAESQLDAARKRLSALWGDLTPDFEAVAGSIADTPVPPATESLIAFLPDNPFLARFAAEALERQARLELALAESRPDYTIRGGVQGFADSGEMALTVGITIPTQRSGRNPGDIREAEIRLEQIESQRGATHLQLQAQLVDAVERLRAAYNRAQSLCDEVIPAAIDNLDRTGVGYRYGKFSYLDVLESERTLVEAVASYVEALAEYQAARVDIERIIGRPLPQTPAEVVIDAEGELEVEVGAESVEAAEGITNSAGELETSSTDEGNEIEVLEDGNG
jgi:outer membrane protein, heavy metal efflux system